MMTHRQHRRVLSHSVRSRLGYRVAQRMIAWRRCPARQTRALPTLRRSWH